MITLWQAICPLKKGEKSGKDAVLCLCTTKREAEIAAPAILRDRLNRSKKSPISRFPWEWNHMKKYLGCYVEKIEIGREA